MIEEAPLLTIVATSCTMRRFRDVCDLLDSIKRQTYPNIEIIFVAEKSKELFERVKLCVKEQNLSNVHVVFNDGLQGLSAARNLGVKIAEGEMLVFVDDDVILPPHFAVEVARTYLQNPDAIGVTGLICPLWVNGFVSWFPEEFDWIFSCSRWFPSEELIEIRNVFGANFSFRRETFEKCGLFDTRYGFPKGTYEGFLGEDNELSLRVHRMTGKRIVHNPHVWVYHKVHSYRLRWPFIIGRSFNMGRSRRVLKRIYKGRDEGLFDMEHSLLKRIIANLPIRILRTIFGKPVEGLKMLSVTIIILVFVALGYLK